MFGESIALSHLLTLLEAAQEEEEEEQAELARAKAQSEYEEIAEEADGGEEENDAAILASVAAIDRAVESLQAKERDASEKKTDETVVVVVAEEGGFAKSVGEAIPEPVAADPVLVDTAAPVASVSDTTVVVENKLENATVGTETDSNKSAQQETASSDVVENEEIDEKAYVTDELPSPESANSSSFTANGESDGGEPAEQVFEIAEGVQMAREFAVVDEVPEEEPLSDAELASLLTKQQSMRLVDYLLDFSIYFLFSPFSC